MLNLAKIRSIDVSFLREIALYVQDKNHLLGILRELALESIK